MNKIHLQWLFRPAWQLLLGQLAIWCTIGLLTCLLALVTVRKATISGKNELIARKSEIEQYKQQLLLLPAPSTIKQQTNDLVNAKKNKCCHHNQTLLQRINESLSISGGKLLIWQEKESLIENHVMHKHGDLTIEITYLNLILFLQEILSLQPAIQIKRMNISTGQNELTAEFELAERLWGVDDA